MSSVVAFLRALVMVACLVAVPVLAISQGSTISRGLQAAARFLDRLSADQAEEADDGALLASGVLRSARPMPSAPGTESQKAHAMEQGPSTLLPEPVEDRDISRQVIPPTPEWDGPGTEARAPHAQLPSGVPPTSAEPSHMAAWQEMASALQQLGALEYALEKWGDSGELYRFRCLAAVPGTTSYQRHFHAVDGDGGRAVERVVEQVREWRAAATRVD